MTNQLKTLAFLVTLFCLLTPLVDGQTPPTISVKLFYPNAKRDSGECGVKVYPIARKVPRLSAVAKAALDQLFAGPNSEEKALGYYSDFSDATKSLLISVNIKNGAAYVNLKDLTSTSSVGNFTTSCGGSNFFGQVESTLKQFRSIKRVFYAMEGDPSLFYDWMQIGECPKELKNCDASNFIK